MLRYYSIKTTIKYILKNIGIQMGMTPLIWAIQEQHMEVVDMLINKGADVDLADVV